MLLYQLANSSGALFRCSAKGQYIFCRLIVFRATEQRSPLPLFLPWPRSARNLTVKTLLLCWGTTKASNWYLRIGCPGLILFGVIFTVIRRYIFLQLYAATSRLKMEILIRPKSRIVNFVNVALWERKNLKNESFLPEFHSLRIKIQDHEPVRSFWTGWYTIHLIVVHRSRNGYGHWQQCRRFFTSGSQLSYASSYLTRTKLSNRGYVCVTKVQKM